ncbi:hypothetical protein ACT009_14720 [Sphingomonas sp. Tas61C01]|uniref:hypothetical protein n=1 Tax=Sphingomonas sp. Tas61C01 TaxID=3458297 RepID=UPI00403E7D9D
MTVPTWVEPRQAAQRWTWENKPGYIEAYPRISVGEVLREARAGRTHLLWRDRQHRAIGAASVEITSKEAVDLHYAADELPYSDESAGDLPLRLAWKGSLPHNKRPFAHCPKCSRSVDVLVLREGRWACTKCHKLIHRSALLSEEVRWSERLADVEAEIGMGRPAASRTSAFAAKLVQRDDLLQRLAGKRITANVLYLTRISTEWIHTPMPVLSGLP